MRAPGGGRKKLSETDPALLSGLLAGVAVAFKLSNGPVAIVLPVLFPGSLVPLAGKSPLFSWHIALSTLAYGSLTIAAFHAVLMAMQESRLHSLASAVSQRSWFAGAIDRLPALGGKATAFGIHIGLIATKEFDFGQHNQLGLGRGKTLAQGCLNRHDGVRRPLGLVVIARKCLE